ncbi:MAG: hypothetical protein OEQ13_04430 [Acidobacteriota bacterium]|nr:hypothetical protein [Acidobacteriota bacterium]
MSPIAIIGIAALAVLAVGWIIVSVSSPGRRRTLIEWVAAAALYVFLLTIFARGLRWALEADSTAGLIGFGFLCVFFGAGLILSLVATFRAGRAERKPSVSATN